MDPIDLLLVEHRQIARVLDRIEVECYRIRGGEPLLPVFFRRVADFLAEYVDGSHLNKETALFRALAPYGLASAPSAVVKIVEEHEVTHSAAEELAKLAEAVSLGKASDRELIAAAIDYVRRFRDHAMEEERTVFPLARRLLVPAAREGLRSKLARIEAAHLPIAEAVHVFERAFPTPENAPRPAAGMTKAE